VFSILLLFPAALVTSIAAYKLKNHLKHSMITHMEGCGSLFWAVVMTALGMVSVVGIVGGALSTGTAVLAAQSTPGNALVSFSSGAGGADSLSVTPGPMLGAIALVFSVLASALLVGVWFGFPWVRALPGFGPPSCCTPSTTITYPSTTITYPHSGMGGGREVYNNNPLSAAAPGKGGVGGVVVAGPPLLPPGWSKQGPTQSGAYWYVDPSGVSHWDFPRA